MNIDELKNSGVEVEVVEENVGHVNGLQHVLLSVQKDLSTQVGHDLIIFVFSDEINEKVGTGALFIESGSAAPPYTIYRGTIAEDTAIENIFAQCVSNLAETMLALFFDIITGNARIESGQRAGKEKPKIIMARAGQAV